MDCSQRVKESQGQGLRGVMVRREGCTPVFPSSCWSTHRVSDEGQRLGFRGVDWEGRNPLLPFLHYHTFIAVGLRLRGTKGQQDSGEYSWPVLGGGGWQRKPLWGNHARLTTWKMRRDRLGKEHGRQLNQAEEQHVKRPRVQQSHRVFKETEEARVT